MLKFDKDDLIIKKLLSKQALLKHFTDYDIFRRYCGEFTPGVAFLSPLRDEKNPSFSIFYSKSNELIFKDHLGPTGDFLKFIQIKWGLNYYEAMVKICIDFNLQKYFVLRKNNKNVPLDNNPIIKYSRPENNNNVLTKKRRKWHKNDFKFWSTYGISYKTLKKYNVEPISFYFFNDTPIKADNYAYCFTETKDGQETYTIYQPFNKENKWKKSHDSSVWYGWEQLPSIANTIIITKSHKDIMSLSENANIPATSLQNEKTIPKPHVMEDIVDRFNQIFVLYDNDYDKDTNWGRQLGKALADRYGFLQIEIPSEYKSKDFSDLVSNIGSEKAIEVLNKLIKECIPF